MPKITWKIVFLIWLLALPSLAGTGYLIYQKYPAPFLTAAAWAQKGYAMGQAAYQDHQKKEAAKKAQEKAAADKAKKEAEQAQQADGAGWQ